MAKKKLRERLSLKLGATNILLIIMLVIVMYLLGNWNLPFLQISPP